MFLLENVTDSSINKKNICLIIPKYILKNMLLITCLRKFICTIIGRMVTHTKYIRKNNA